MKATLERKKVSPSPRPEGNGDHSAQLCWEERLCNMKRSVIDRKRSLQQGTGCSICMARRRGGHLVQIRQRKGEIDGSGPTVVVAIGSSNRRESGSNEADVADKGASETLSVEQFDMSRQRLLLFTMRRGCDHRRRKMELSDHQYATIGGRQMEEDQH
ncbi:hypothetical protein OPV22_013379 [Ensete ventricosum]|uniref:Uncharacterized protein n=1 Tax=Ensete ventricosum TaxID=4639 RepID=A0AAV8R0W8_ENSVE|nr:hypothetical protein OPV22_013379 [Ensete ventricosum]